MGKQHRNGSCGQESVPPPSPHGVKSKTLRHPAGQTLRAWGLCALFSAGCPTAVVTAPPDPGQRVEPPTEGVRDLVLGMQAMMAPSASPQAAAKPVETPESAGIPTGLIGAAYQVLSARTLRGHRDAVNTAAFSPDGQLVVTASADVTARVYEAWTGKERLRLSGHAASVNSASFSPDGKWLVTASADHTARVFSAATGRSQQVLKGHTGNVNFAGFSGDGTRILTASTDQTARLWTLAPGGSADSGWNNTATLKGHSAGLNGAAFSPDGLRVATASDDKTARISDVESGRVLVTLNGHTAAVHTVAFSPDGKQVVTASADQTAIVWNSEDGREISSLKGHSAWVYAAAFSPDGKYVLTASEDGTARLWDLGTSKELARYTGHGAGILSAAFSSDGSALVTAGIGIFHVGVEQKACTLCGDCVSGCNHRAKNTTLMNYLPDAVNHGARLFTEASVRFVARTSLLRLSVR